MKKNLNTYSNLKNELEREGINIPEFDKLNVNAITPADFALAIDVVGKDTTVKMIFEPGFVLNLGVNILNLKKKIFMFNPAIKLFCITFQIHDTAILQQLT